MEHFDVASWMFLALLIIGSCGVGFMSALGAAFFEYRRLPKVLRLLGAIFLTLLSTAMFTISAAMAFMVIVYFLDDMPMDENQARAYWREHNNTARQIWLGSMIFGLWLALRVTKYFENHMRSWKGFPLIWK
jgi:hypothetical protein